jgi:hypothetical protein
MTSDVLFWFLSVWGLISFALVLLILIEGWRLGR